jgi:hypothetical protein
VVFDDHVYWCRGASLFVSPPKLTPRRGGDEEGGSFYILMIRLALFSPTIVASLGRFSIPQSLLLSTPRTSLLYTFTMIPTLPYHILTLKSKKRIKV